MHIPDSKAVTSPTPCHRHLDDHQVEERVEVATIDEPLHCEDNIRSIWKKKWQVSIHIVFVPRVSCFGCPEQSFDTRGCSF